MVTGTKMTKEEKKITRYINPFCNSPLKHKRMAGMAKWWQYD